MLVQLHIRDFIIVDELELDFDRGLTILTGETGAGKSILVDALCLALGDRSDSGCVRAGCERTDISACFDLSDHVAARQWLEAQELEGDELCHLRRVISKEGRSRGYINGRPVPLANLQALGRLLVDIHGQHEHQSLLRRDQQRHLLDAYAEHSVLTQRLTTLYANWRTQSDAITELSGNLTEQTAKQELLTYQVNELEQLNPTPGEYEAISEEHQKLAHAGEILESCQRNLTVLYEAEEGTVHQLLSRSESELAAWSGLDTHLAGAHELLSTALIQVQEASDALRTFRDNTEIDPERLDWLDSQLAAFHDLARKHQCKPQELPAQLTRLQQELADITHSDDRLQALNLELEQLTTEYNEVATKLTASRQKSAKKLTKKISKAMQELGMPGGKFQVTLLPNDGAFSPHGQEKIEFQVSANPGQPLKPLTKVASGGELSRISLAIQVITAKKGEVPTLIYDEVDVGIGGGTAEIVGRQLRSLATARQVLCITHLPQVAAQGEQHLQVSKSVSKGQTWARIRVLDSKERIAELSRMLGGVEITQQTTAHAEEMIARAQQV